MLRETTNAQTDEIKSRLESIRLQADIVCQLSAERLQHLEAALPLATHFSENQTEIQGWLDEMEADIKAQGAPGDNLEQIKKQYDNIKVCQSYKKCESLELMSSVELFFNCLKKTRCTGKIICPYESFVYSKEYIRQNVIILLILRSFI